MPIEITKHYHVKRQRIPEDILYELAYFTSSRGSDIHVENFWVTFVLLVRIAEDNMPTKPA
jgi:hypothetical protein